jgi:transposase InsO family protein
MTDNAWAHQHSIQDVCAQLGARQKFVKPHCPWQNGKIERLNRILVTVGLPAGVHQQRAARPALAPWIEHYNLNAAPPHSAAAHRSAD